METSQRKKAGASDRFHRKRVKKEISVKNQLIRKKRKMRTQKETAKQKEYRIWRQWLSKGYGILENILFILFVCLCLYSLMNFRSHFVSGQSMEPTLQNGDRLLTHKGKAIHRYDIVTFDQETEDSSYVKRVIGMPGDKVCLNKGRLYLVENLFSAVDLEELIHSGQLPDSTIVLQIDSEALCEQLKEIKEIPQDHYFVLGDNRNRSTDSRTLGFIKAEQIEGVVDIRYFPFNKAGFIH
ncbi:signal peptidase I [Enterococcus sp. BWT-B8]|uniref:signal peptidase I n=1 Tax=unclassified Enterococcus TaxID=2608891 RepID=UPI001E52C06C|nr:MULTISPECIES: signal peptidase I [unclassified Enterococcus]MCB5951341.1 signal peptidase I [Enterococcus sp. BWT-B8]MCB5956350.1 signal peptidase I [Enterococcus sp. CWB-B31]